MDSSAFIDNYRFLARYNRWFNERLYAACEPLADPQRKLDRGAFFGSIHRTLNHVMWGDRMWLQRFNRQGFEFPAFAGDVLDLPDGAMHGAVLYEDWAELSRQRERLDAAIEAWVGQMPVDFPMRTMRYSNSMGVQREHPAWQALTHFFNHQTHHRGQVTTLLAQAGVDPGVTDLIALV
ncbi:MAG TPA: DinB family protein [Ramlibacter sp.]|nr:DinB family protein [Ramlibacter sp.]